MMSDRIVAFPNTVNSSKSESVEKDKIPTDGQGVQLHPKMVERIFDAFSSCEYVGLIGHESSPPMKAEFRFRTRIDLMKSWQKWLVDHGVIGLPFQPRTTDPACVLLFIINNLEIVEMGEDYLYVFKAQEGMHKGQPVRTEYIKGLAEEDLQGSVVIRTHITGGPTKLVPRHRNK